MGRNGLSLLLTVLLLLVAGSRCQDLSTLQDVVERHAELIEQLQAQIAAFNQRLGECFSHGCGRETILKR